MLGSSTAAGAGASSSDSAWVNKYRNYLQSLNPGNQVTNLARGGYNTYKLMPDNFVPPSNRPANDTLRNISKAIAINADAIIVNLPSNDVASGYSLNEQIFNMDSIFNTAQQAGIPIWICTTQPRNFSIAQMQLQKDMKDSIEAHYGSYSIDFWKHLALINNSLDPYYDSGDGVHLNDIGHNVLFNKVKDKDIIASIFQPKTFTDIVISKIELLNPDICQTGSKDFKVTFSNLGISTADSALLIFDLIIQNQSIYRDTVSFSTAINPCTFHSKLFNTSIQGQSNYTISAKSLYSLDSANYNDSLAISYMSIGSPVITVIDDTLCHESNALLKANTSSVDTIFWYVSALSTTALSNGSDLIVNNASADSTFYAQAVRGELFYKSEISTTPINNIDFNGAMFDIMAHDSLIIDSLALKILTMGMQTIELRICNGSHLGKESDSSQWTFMGNIQVNVNDPEAFINIDIPDLSLSPGDTIGIYLQMANSNSRLRYRSLSSPITRSTSEISIMTGSGIAHNFNGSFFPRDWNGKVFYHYGYRPGGDCSSQKVPVRILFSDQHINLGADTSIGLTQNIILAINQDFHSLQWEDGSDDNPRIIQGTDYGQGIFQFSILAMDSLNCLKYDTISLTFDVLDLKGAESEHFKLFPNPVENLLFLKCENPEDQKIEIIDILGAIHEVKIESANIIDVSNLKKGIYMLKISNTKNSSTLNFIKQ
ncbi:MAG: GDSL-type esterase/lipase family protein [Cytophagales bacterium]